MYLNTLTTTGACRWVHDNLIVDQLKSEQGGERGEGMRTTEDNDLIFGTMFAQPRWLSSSTWNRNRGPRVSNGPHRWPCCIGPVQQSCRIAIEHGMLLAQQTTDNRQPPSHYLSVIGCTSIVHAAGPSTTLTEQVSSDCLSDQLTHLCAWVGLGWHTRGGGLRIYIALQYDNPCG